MKKLPLVMDPMNPGALELGHESLKSLLSEFDSNAALRARQLERWILQGRATKFEEMSDLPAQLRSLLPQKLLPLTCSVAHGSTALDGTRKLLIKLADSHTVETVLMFEDDRRTVCISTQVGCGMGCTFCASGIAGVARNLKSHEIIEQLILARNELPQAERITHVVVMGMGEPMANLPNLLDALSIATSPKGLGISARNVTISTVGIPGKILELAESGRKYHLAISLHAPEDALRSRLMPTNEKTGIEKILEAAGEFFTKTGRQVTYEYILLGGVNDRQEDADALGRLLEGRKAHVNLIPFNPVDGLPWIRPDNEAIARFRQSLEKRRVSASVRKRKGADIDAACGQLRRRHEAPKAKRPSS